MPTSLGQTGRTSLSSRRDAHSSEIMDQYATLNVDPQAVYLPTWPYPNDEEFKARFIKQDVSKMLRNKIIGKFSGKASDYERFKAVFYPNVHVQRAPVYLKAAALDSLMEPEVRDEVFGIGLGNSEFDYAERLERLERMFGGTEKLVDSTLNKIKSLLNQSRKDYGKLRKLVNTIYFFIQGIGSCDANSLSLREHLREGMPPSLLKRYMEETEERGQEDTLKHMLDWTHRNVRMHFKHKEFEELLEKKPKEGKKKGKPIKPKAREEEAFAFLADSETTTSSGEEVAEVHYQTQERCPHCQGTHTLYKCEGFYNLLPLQRRKYVHERKLCLVCYGPGHQAEECRFTSYKCRFGCKSRHNIDVHITAEDYKKWKESKEQPAQGPSGPAGELSSLVYSMDQQAEKELREVCYMAKGAEGPSRPPPSRRRSTAVTTLLIKVTNPQNGQTEQAYAMADTGASNTHAASSLGKRLGLRGVLGPFVVGSHGGRVQEYEVMECRVQLEAADGSYRRLTSAKCYPNPCGHMEAPDWRAIQSEWPHLKYLPLPQGPANHRVEVIIGTDCLDAMEAVAPVVFGQEGEPCAKLTKLGWVLGGRVGPSAHPTGKEMEKVNPSQFCGFMREITSAALEERWNIEGPAREYELANSYSPKRLTSLEIKATEMFKQGLKYRQKRYHVPLMWKGEERPSGNYKEAKALFLRQEEYMRPFPELEVKFQENITKWIKHEWASVLPKEVTTGFFIPTFMVVRVDKATTKFRLIMNGAYEFEGRCINDFLLPGPSRMNRLCDVLVRFRRGLYVLACDIESMFLNIRVDEKEDPKYLRVLFREPSTGQVRALQCNTHVFGLTQSPYVAMEVVRYHVQKYGASYPYAEQAVRSDIIVDDIMHSTNSKEKLIKTQTELVALFELALMGIHKWVTNLPELWAQLPGKQLKGGPKATPLLRKNTSYSVGVLKRPGQQ